MGQGGSAEKFGNTLRISEAIANTSVMKILAAQLLQTKDSRLREDQSVHNTSFIKFDRVAVDLRLPL